MKKTILVYGFVATLALLLGGCDSPVQPVGSAPSNSEESTTKNGKDTPVVVDSLLTRRNFFVILDGSGSMTEHVKGEAKIDVAKKAIIEFSKTLKPEDNLGLLAFDNSGNSERLLLGTNNRNEFAGQIQAVVAGNGTPLYEAIEFAFGRLQEQMRKQLNYGEYHIVVVTDGEANGQSENGLIDKISQSPVVLHTIGFNIGTGHSLNQPGKTYYADARDPAQLRQSLKAVLAESEKFGN